MAFPVVASSNTTADTDGTSTTINMPSGITAGDLLLVFDVNDATGTARSQSGGSDWTRIQTGANGSVIATAIFAKIAAGSDTLTLAGAAQDSATVSVRVTGHGVTNVAVDILLGTPATGNDAAPNPPDVAHGGPLDYLVLEYAGSDDDDDTATYWSANYSAVNQVQSANSTSSCLASVGQRSINGTSENPGVMALAATEEWVAHTISIPPSLGTEYTKVSDSFTRADSGDLGTTWDVVSGKTACAIVSNQVGPSANAVTCLEVDNSTTLADKQWAKATLSSFGSANEIYAGVAVRHNAGDIYYAMAAKNRGDSNTIRLREIVGGADNLLGTTTGATWATNDVIKLIAAGTRLIVQQNDVSRLVVVDPSITSGKTGIGAETVTASTDVRIDTWSAGDYNPSLAAASGSYTLTGTSTTLIHGYPITAVSGVYTLTGTAATLRTDYRLSAVSGSYTLTGTAASLEGGFLVAANSGVYLINGTAANLNKGFALAVDSGAYTVIGTASSLLATRLLTAVSGAYLLTGTVAALEADRVLFAGVGVYLLTGTAAAFIYTPTGGSEDHLLMLMGLGR